MAKIIVNEELTQDCQIEKGTRQGCPPCQRMYDKMGKKFWL